MFVFSSLFLWSLFFSAFPVFYLFIWKSRSKDIRKDATQPQTLLCCTVEAGKVLLSRHEIAPDIHPLSKWPLCKKKKKGNLRVPDVGCRFSTDRVILPSRRESRVKWESTPTLHPTLLDFNTGVHQPMHWEVEPGSNINRSQRALEKLLSILCKTLHAWGWAQFWRMSWSWGLW